jgi:hypothetical protein
VDDELHEPVRATRLLAWATAGLMAFGVISAGVVSRSNASDPDRVVSAAGAGAEGVETPTTVAVTVPPTVPPPTVAAPTTTAAPAVVARPTTTTLPTTQPPRATATTRAPASTTTSTTAAAVAPAGVMLTVVNGHPMAVVLKVNDRTFNLAPNERVGPVPLNRYAHGNDIIEVSVSQHPQCATGDADRHFGTPGNYELTVATPLVGGGCAGGVAGVGFVVFKV